MRSTGGTPRSEGAHASRRDSRTTESAIRPSQRRFGIICLLAYVALSWAVRFDMRRGDQIASLVYPLDTFSMYAGTVGRDASHLLVRDRDGPVHRVTAFRSFECGEPITGSAAQCADRRGFEYHYDDLIHYIESHPGAGDTDVELIARTWQLRRGAPPVQDPDCIIAHCRVSR